MKIYSSCLNLKSYILIPVQLLKSGHQGSLSYIILKLSHGIEVMINKFLLSAQIIQVFLT